MNVRGYSMKKQKDADNQGKRGKNIGCRIDDPIHPIQFWGNTESQRCDPLLPDKKLWAAVLKDALDCLSGHVSAEVSRAKRVAEVEKAREWFLSERKDAGSFIWVCKMLDLASELILKEVNGLCGDKEMAA